MQDVRQLDTLYLQNVSGALLKNILITEAKNTMKLSSISLSFVVAGMLCCCAPSQNVQENNSAINQSGTNAVVSNSKDVTAIGNSTSGNLPECVKTRCHCKDFKTKAEALLVLKSFPGDPHKLDRNKDGIACQTLP